MISKMKYEIAQVLDVDPAIFFFFLAPSQKHPGLKVSTQKDKIYSFLAYSM